MLFRLSHDDRLAAAKGWLYARWCATNVDLSETDVVYAAHMWTTSDVAAADMLSDPFDCEVAQLDVWLLADELMAWVEGVCDDDVM